MGGPGRVLFFSNYKVRCLIDPNFRLANIEQWDNETQNNVRLQEVGQCNGERPWEIAGGSNNEYNGQE